MKRFPILVLSALLALAPGVAVAAPGPTPSPGTPLDAPGTPAATGDRLTIGLQPASATAPDPRAHYDFRLAPNAVRVDHVAVFNYSAKPVVVGLAARDALTTRGGGLDVEPTATKPRDVGAWIALGATRLRLAPRTRVIVPFQLGLPYNAAPGDHTGAIVASLVTTSTSPDGRRVEVENRVGLRIYLRVAGAVTRRLSVTALRASFRGGARPLAGGPVDVSFTLRNTGNVRLGARERVTVRDAFGRTVGSALLDAPLVLLPGSSIPVAVRVGPVVGTVRMSASVDVEPLRLEGDPGPDLPHVTRSVSFWALPWLSLLGLCLLVAGLVGWRVRRRRRPPRRARHRREPGPPKHAEERVPAALFTSITLGFVVLLAVLVAGPALAAESANTGPAGPWAATIVPRSGADDTPFEVTTSGGCPAPATNVVARVFGAGLPAEGVNVVGNTAANVRADSAFRVPLVVTMRDVARDQATVVTLHGRYVVDVVCRTARDPKPIGVYRAAVVFSSGTTWVADKPVTTAKGPVAPHQPGAGDGAGTGSVPGAGPGAAGAPGSAGSAGALPGTGQAGTAAGAAAGAAGGLASGSGRGSHGSVPSPLLLLGIGAVVSAAFVAGRRRGARVVPARPAPVRPLQSTPEGNSRP
jgi:hypothetical protein